MRYAPHQRYFIDLIVHFFAILRAHFFFLVVGLSPPVANSFFLLSSQSGGLLSHRPLWSPDVACVYTASSQSALIHLSLLLRSEMICFGERHHLWCWLSFFCSCYCPSLGLLALWPWWFTLMPTPWRRQQPVCLLPCPYHPWRCLL